MGLAGGLDFILFHFSIFSLVLGALVGWGGVVGVVLFTE